MQRWTFVRHGQSRANAEGWFAGHTDAELTSEGMEQAARAAQRLASTTFDRVLCSDLTRAHATAGMLVNGTGHTPVATPALRERSCGSWERRPIADLQDAGELKIFASWDGRPGGGESLRDVFVRVAGFLVELPASNHTLVVAHGALMRAVIGMLDNLPTDLIGLWRPRNCEAFVRTATTARWRELLNEHA